MLTIWIIHHCWSRRYEQRVQQTVKVPLKPEKYLDQYNNILHNLLCIEFIINLISWMKKSRLEFFDSKPWALLPLLPVRCLTYQTHAKVSFSDWEFIEYFQNEASLKSCRSAVTQPRISSAGRRAGRHVDYILISLNVRQKDWEKNSPQNQK